MSVMQTLHLWLLACMLGGACSAYVLAPDPYDPLHTCSSTREYCCGNDENDSARVACADERVLTHHHDTLL